MAYPRAPFTPPRLGQTRGQESNHNNHRGLPQWGARSQCWPIGSMDFPRGRANTSKHRGVSFLYFFLLPFSRSIASFSFLPSTVPPQKEALTTISLVNTCTAGNLFNRWWIKRQAGSEWRVQTSPLLFHLVNLWKGKILFYMKLINNSFKRIYPNSVFTPQTWSLDAIGWKRETGCRDYRFVRGHHHSWILPKNESRSLYVVQRTFPVSSV